MLLGNESRGQSPVELMERKFASDPEDAALLEEYYRCVQECGDYRRAESVLAKAYGLFPCQRIVFKLIDALIQQGKPGRAIALIETAMVRFGFDEGFLDAALQVRRLAGAAEPSARRPSLSLCMIVKNEQDYLPFCLESVKSLVDEVVVVDTGSSDRTLDVAAIFGAKVYSFPWNGSFADCRNVSLSKATCDWILVMDADEVISAGDCASLRRRIEHGAEGTAFSLMIRNYCDRANLLGWQANDGGYLEQERGKGWYPSQMIRLFPNRPEIRFEAPVHETVQPSLLKLGYRIARWEGVVHHYGKLNQSKDAAKRDFYYELGKKKLLEGPASAEAVAELAVQAAELRKYDEAISLWERVVALCPDYAEGYLNLGCCLEMAGGRYGEALVQARRAMQLKPDLKEAIYNCAKYELYIGDEERSLELIRGLSAKDPEYPPAVVLLCVLHIVRDELAQCGPLLSVLNERGFAGTDSLRHHAGILGALGKTGHAEKLAGATRLPSQGS